MSWLEDNKDLLGNRYEAYAFLNDQLSNVSNPVIVETGSIRQPGNINGDGNSTYLFNDLTLNGGKVYTLDIDPICAKHCNRLFGDNVISLTGDSLETIKLINEPIDCLFLDSYDLDWNNDQPSANHALIEYETIKQWLKSGTLIAVDDNNDQGGGKGRFLRQVAAEQGWTLLVDSYILVWKLN